MKRRNMKNNPAVDRANAVVILVTTTRTMIPSLPHHIDRLGPSRLIGHPDPMPHHTSHQGPMTATVVVQGQEEEIVVVEDDVHEVQAPRAANIIRQQEAVVAARDNPLLDPSLVDRLRDQETLIAQAAPRKKMMTMLQQVAIVTIVHRIVHDVSVQEDISK